MSGSRNLRDFLQQFQVFGMFAELVIADQRTEWLAAEKAVLLLVDFLEHRALIKFRRPLQVAQQVLLRRIQNANLQLGSSLRLIEQILQSAPRGFEFLELGVV